MKKIIKKSKLTSIFAAFAVAVSGISGFFAAPAFAEEEYKLDSKIIVSMGDSYSSGEGIEDFYCQDYNAEYKVQEQDWLAHRSEESWPGRLKLHAVSEDEPMSEFKDENWYFVATSGAKTEHIKNDFEKKYDKDGYKGSKRIDAQIKIFEKLREENKQADYVTLTLGGNDAEFDKVVTDAALEFMLPNLLTDKLNEVWNKFYEEDGIRDNLKKAYKDIADAAGPQAKIIVAGYPKLLDENGGFSFTKEAAALVNNSVSRFNKEIEAIVNSCKAEGMKICFVDVEEEFEGHGAYSSDSWINEVMLLKQAEDIEDSGLLSSYSMHPDKNGAEAYAKCVQEKIEEIEKDGGATEWPDMLRSEEREVALVLDVSGSMQGTPIEETKKASSKFINTVLEEDSSIGIVTYDSSAMAISDFCMNEQYLVNSIKNINSGGGTNMYAGLEKAYEQLETSKSDKKIIVLMSDGEPNEGKVGDELTDFAEEIKNDGVIIYTLGFFNQLSNKSGAQQLMEQIASPGCHYEVETADDLVFFFGDMADQINGTRYIHIRIACPVEVSVECGGEELNSSEKFLNTRTDFGILTFEDIEGSDDKVKTLRLKEEYADEYKVKINGTDDGTMNYTISFSDENGEYNDKREFEDIDITEDTEITTIAANKKTTYMEIDEDGDGKIDIRLKATANSKAEVVDYTWIIWLIGGAVVLLIVLILFLIIKVKLEKYKLKRVYMTEKIICAKCGNEVRRGEFCDRCGKKAE